MQGHGSKIRRLLGAHPMDPADLPRAAQFCEEPRHRIQGSGPISSSLFPGQAKHAGPWQQDPALSGQGMIPRRREQQGPRDAGESRRAPGTQERAAVDCPAGDAAGNA